MSAPHAAEMIRLRLAILLTALAVVLSIALLIKETAYLFTVFMILGPALLLLAMGGIHLYLALNGVGGVLGLLFVLNAVGALVLAVAIVALRRRPLLVASVLSLLFMLGTLLALVFALTVGLVGIRETLDFQLVPTTLVVELIGTIVLMVTTAMVFRLRRGV